ncbi:sensor histidine kinase [Streptosporangium becharense]|uniref:sensor histidine kinase n=1 Tax=Streptosporangium becharense TaxID=1816182 RepID=UPI002889493B|nr:ATP-binding protein [Streptosporangium becharense]
MRLRLTLIAMVTAVASGLALTVVATISLYGLAGGYRTEEAASGALEVVHLIKSGRLPQVLPEGRTSGIQVLDPQGRIVSSTRNLVGAPRVADFVPPSTVVRQDRRICDAPHFPRRCVKIVAFRISDPGGDWMIYATATPVPWYAHSGLFAVIVGSSLLGVAMSGIGAYRTVTGSLEPVRAIRRELEEITATDLGRRVPVPPARDEIRQLAETINQTLDRLEAAAEQQRRFASDASHDLRSPLTAMRAQVEEALHYPEDVDWKSKAHEMLASLDRLQAIVSDLLVLARLDSGIPAARERIDLGTLVGDELDRRRRRVEVVRDLESGVMVTGDRLRLARLLTNLLDNAERHAISRVGVRVAGEDGTAVLEVLDDGAGIPPEYRELVFRRFTRLDAARNRDAGGTGLGLPIAREVAESHGGTLKVEDSTRGARFVLRIPRAD